MINNVVLVGRITKDPEVRTISSGSATCSFTLAIDRNFQSQQGERQADFIPCVAWNQSAQFIGNYVKKGYLLGVEGRIQTRSYQDQQGQTRYVTEVVCNRVENLTPRETSNTSNNYDANNNNYQGNSGNVADKSYNQEISDDDLPF